MSGEGPPAGEGEGGRGGFGRGRGRGGTLDRLNEHSIQILCSLS
jgi:hypothetical protein